MTRRERQPADEKDDGGAAPEPDPVAEPDAELAAWEAYLDRLHRADPPGRAPHERA